MKRCPSCQRTYDDEKTFCMVEGTKLVTLPPVDDDPQPTMFAPSPKVINNPALGREAHTEVLATDFSGRAPSQPLPYVPFSQSTEAQAERSGMLLKIVGGALLLAVGLGLGFVIARSNSKTAATQSSATPATTSSTQNDATVLSELKELEDQMTGASIKGDKATLERMLADDYSATGADGKFYNRTQTLYSTEPMPSVTSWSVDSARLLSRSEASATLTATVVFRTEKSMEKQQITDTFMKRDGRWQLVASQSTLLK